MPTIAIPTSTAPQILQQASMLLGDPGFQLIAVIALGFPFGFFVLSKLIRLIPGVNEEISEIDEDHNFERWRRDHLDD